MKRFFWANSDTRNTFGLKSNVTSLIYKQGIVPFICYGSQICGTALKKKINDRHLRKIQRRILLRVITGYRTISYESVFAISGFGSIDIFIVHNRFSRLRRRPVKPITKTSVFVFLRCLTLLNGLLSI
ncbi:hypothetical protein AVEN_248836-1 [Araneus ventricosus]|uniref:Uncharacterized protein n=1 Tax=Araneus ventricosus TaxID=182803 RepID=A0A4Y2HXH1_ARAVE|nr:hypothetical protein AVEN_248836-1 [Araneus ventricosus]